MGDAALLNGNQKGRVYDNYLHSLGCAWNLDNVGVVRVREVPPLVI